jgi:hypothetical protein
MAVQMMVDHRIKGSHAEVDERIECRLIPQLKKQKEVGFNPCSLPAGSLRRLQGYVPAVQLRAQGVETIEEEVGM